MRRPVGIQGIVSAMFLFFSSWRKMAEVSFLAKALVNVDIDI